MGLNIQRRGFLLSLIALGASYALQDRATAQEVNQVWKRALADPWHFSVNDHGTIVEPDHPQQESWGDIFNISTAHMSTSQELIGEVEGCVPLQSHMQNLASDELDDLQHELEELGARNSARRAHLRRLIKALESDPDEGWRDWIDIEGPRHFERFRAMIQNWADGPADYRQSEWFPIGWGAQGKAKLFFESLDRQVLDALGVVIVDGEHPGSTYYAAELLKDLDDANRAAAELALPFRFQREAG